MIKFAEDDSSIKAVNIIMDSPGGEVSKIEEIYLEVLRLRAKKPVVIAVDGSALSGGYYVSSAADFIYVKPSSEIGSIGVISSLPEVWKPDGEQITTGPFKASGKSRKSYAFQVEAIKKAFLEAVVSQRGDKLHIDPERLSTAEIFLGSEGVKYGLADAIGTDSDAVRKAAGIAGIANYDTLNINDAMNITFTGKFHGLAEMNKTVTPANYYIYQELEDQ
ncbi:Peptidase family S49 [uncultured archaeon]|nr:Peptidase family S49 [uncultured archaeon]